MSDIELDAGTFRHVLGHYPTGVSAITAASGDGRPIGMIVGTFTSVSLNPPLVGFLPDKKSSTWPAIRAAGRFCVNILAHDQEDICRKLARKGAEKFTDVGYMLSEFNLPIISGAVATIECSLHSITDAGDHDFVLGLVKRMRVERDDHPMLFIRGQYAAPLLADAQI